MILYYLLPDVIDGIVLEICESDFKSGQKKNYIFTVELTSPVTFCAWTK